jgi:hypothetical protein
MRFVTTPGTPERLIGDQLVTFILEGRPVAFATPFRPATHLEQAAASAAFRVVPPTSLAYSGCVTRSRGLK